VISVLRIFAPTLLAVFATNRRPPLRPGSGNPPRKGHRQRDGYSLSGPRCKSARAALWSDRLRGGIPGAKCAARGHGDRIRQIGFEPGTFDIRIPTRASSGVFPLDFNGYLLPAVVVEARRRGFDAAL